MGIDLIYKGDGRRFRNRFSLTEWDTLSLLEPHLPDALEVMIGVPEMGVEVPVSLDRLREAVEEIDDYLRDQSEKLPLTYAYKKEYIELNGSRYDDVDQEFCTGSMSGIRFPGDEVHYYEISASLDECLLIKRSLRPDGRGRIVEKRDLRGEKYLQTQTLGRVEFRAFREKTGIREQLGEIRDFLSSLSGGEVTKKIS